MSAYSEYFLNSKSSIVQLECLEISHPNFTQIYRVVRNAVKGVVVTHEDTNICLYTYYPLQIKPSQSRDNLDTSIQVNLGDLGNVLPQELDEISDAAGFDTKPVVKYRTYRSDDLSAPLFGPLILQVTTFSFKREGATFEAHAPLLNLSKTGEVYSIARFPMLRGLL